MRNYQSPLLPDGYYHVYGRGVGNSKLFISDRNYDYFLSKYLHFLGDYINTLAFCLMPNHFHLLIKVKDRGILVDMIKERFGDRINSQNSLDKNNFEPIVSERLAKQFSHFFNAYALAFNKQQKRKGSLFIRPYKRVLIESQSQLRNTIAYIHLNPLAAGITKQLSDWKYASYNSIISESHTRIDRAEVFEIFGSKEGFIEFHGKSLEV